MTAGGGNRRGRRGDEPGARDSGGFAVEESGAVAAGDGGVRFCQNIPPGWSEKRFKYLAQTVKGHIPPSTKGDSPDAKTAPYLSMEYLRGEIERPVFVKADHDSLYAENGDVLLLWDGANAGEFCIAKAGIVSSTMAKIMPIGVDDRFLFWMCKGREDFVRSETVGMGIPHVNGHSLANMRVPLPPLPRQRAIADYLDRETGRLDALVAAKRRLLELLAEKRRALIAQAVTRGLDAEAPTKPTGIEWMQEVPAHWKVQPLRSVASHIVSNVDKVSLEHEIPVRLCNYTDVYHNEFIKLCANFMHATASAEEISKFGLRAGDVLITKDSETWNDIGVPALVCETAPDLVCGYHLALLRPHEQVMCGAFLFRCLQAKPIRLQLELAANGVTRFGLPKSKIGTIILPVPPLPQQRAIADYLDRETGRLDALAGRTRESVALLRELRAALISGAVGGQWPVAGGQ